MQRRKNKWILAIGLCFLCLLNGQGQTDISFDPVYDVGYARILAPLRAAPNDDLEAILLNISEVNQTGFLYNGELVEWEGEGEYLRFKEFYKQYRVFLLDTERSILLRKSPPIAGQRILGIFNVAEEVKFVGVGGLFANTERSDALTTASPANKPGKCYAKSLIPDQYETITEQVLVRQGGPRTIIIPAEYATVTKRELIREAYFELKTIPTEFDTITTKEEIIASRDSIEIVPAIYETATEQIVTYAATTEWVKRPKPDCLSANPEDCLIWFLVETPAQYKTVTKQVRIGCPEGYEDVDGECIKKVTLPAEFEEREKIVVVTPARIDTVFFPAEYETVTSRVLERPAQVRTTSVPAEYTTITKRKLIEKGGFTEWKEVLCADKIPAEFILELQTTLEKKGYPIKTKDNIFGADTKAALVKYQKDNGLPVGNLDLETLKSLGFEVD